MKNVLKNFFLPLYINSKTHVVFFSIFKHFSQSSLNGIRLEIPKRRKYNNQTSICGICLKLIVQNSIGILYNINLQTKKLMISTEVDKSSAWILYSRFSWHLINKSKYLKNTY